MSSYYNRSKVNGPCLGVCYLWIWMQEEGMCERQQDRGELKYLFKRFLLNLTKCGREITAVCNRGTQQASSDSVSICESLCYFVPDTTSLCLPREQWVWKVRRTACTMDTMTILCSIGSRYVRKQTDKCSLYTVAIFGKKAFFKELSESNLCQHFPAVHEHCATQIRTRTMSLEFSLTIAT